MADLIERDAVLAEIGKFQIRFNETGDSHERVAFASAEHCMLVIKAAPAVNRWISVEDALPEKGKFVLCACRANIMCVLKWTGTDWYENPSHCYMSGFVTHWMPIPEIPEPPEKE